MLKLKKSIHTKEDLEQFQLSSTCSEIIEFIRRLDQSVRGKSNLTANEFATEITNKLLVVLEKMDLLVDETPPLPSKSRFGNQAFCTYFDKVQDHLTEFMHFIIPEKHAQYIPEISFYFLNSIGSRERIDYGTGHELNFAMFLFCLEKLFLVGSQDYCALVLVVFGSYLNLMRKLQQLYWLEPAGSHGVWGLDDYQFLPFLFGSAQLIGHKYIRPKSICNKEIVESYGKQYLYLGCIQFILQVKTGSFFEHSPLLYDISGAKTWEKVNEGLVKMFKAEILGKLPIMKHFYFGNLIAFHLEHSDDEHDSNEDQCCDIASQHHGESTDFSTETSNPMFRVTSCCVQRIPSSIAAKNFKS